jgi:DNA-directed RNA polymerase specialized sigma24 family protein
MKSKLAAKCLFEECDYMEVREMLALLPDPEFRIIYLRYWATYSITQISQELRMSWDAVDRRLTHALSTLRSMYPLNRPLQKNGEVYAA